MIDKEQGSTLIIVVWFIAIISIIATFLFYRSEAEWASVVHFENQRKYVQTAEAVLHQYLGLLVKDVTEWDSPEDAWYAKGRTDLAQGGYKVTLIIEDEGSKPNLNTVSEKGLQRIFQMAVEKGNMAPTSPTVSLTPTEGLPTGNPETNLEISLDPLLDWLDRDSEARPEGAEISYYQTMNPSYKPRDGCFSSVEELKQIKNGSRLYELLAPNVTIFGKINPNTISGETFCNLLHSSGDFSDSWLDTVKDQFDNFRIAKNRFERPETLLQLPAISLLTLDKIKGLLHFTGNCNINMATQNNLAVILKEAGYKDPVVNVVLNRRREKPFENVASTYGLLGYTKTKGQVCPDDYLTTTSTIIRYQIWVGSDKGQNRYYLDTIWQRQMTGLKKEWHVTPLSSRELWNKAVPEIPQPEEGKKNDEQNQEPVQNP
ncbi:MAG TPA: hypothetical protein VHY08_07225 [Bacillota bacterium]|nr:hypothetical protein [Bacillota bacterium]